jgi:hypothetical protein
MERTILNIYEHWNGLEEEEELCPSLVSVMQS